MATQSLGRELKQPRVLHSEMGARVPRLHEGVQSTAGQSSRLPAPSRSRSAGELVALLVLAQQSCIQLCKSRKSFYSGLRWQEPASFGDLDQMISAYERDHNILAIQLHSLDDNGWNHQAWLIQGTEEILLKDTVGGLLWIALFDIVHHRGQLSTYIRPMGGKVPSIYGPSADDAGERH